MMTTISAKAFTRFFDFKGNMAPIAEKADRNFSTKLKNDINLQERIHYFAVGHSFKQMDKKTIFNYKTDEQTGKTTPQKFLKIRKENFTFSDELKTLIADLRNLNSHYIHDFSKIKTDVIDNRILGFLEEAFELAAIHIFMQENVIDCEEYFGDKELNKKIVKFLAEKFYPLNDKRKNLTQEEEEKLTEYKQFRNDFLKKSKKEAIDSILYIENPADFEWKIFDTHTVFNVEKGTYLSFHASLFLLSMFLYKNEANQLISKIKGFKRNDDNAFRSKRNLFSFFSKKFSSQDINSEENHLIKFRDIIQFLNHYPKAWNNEIQTETKIPQMTNLLREKIIDLEIKQRYPQKDLKDPLFYEVYDKLFNENYERFVVFAKYNLFGDKIHGKSLKKEYLNCNFSEEEKDAFDFELNKSKKYNDAFRKLKSFEKRKKELDKKQHLGASEKNFLAKYDENLQKTNKTLEEEVNVPKQDTEKLRKRIAKNALYTQYGRNQDRFMEFSLRFLAEKNYFGVDAEFKMYQFSTTYEQEQFLVEKAKTASKKDLDDLIYHDGRITHFCTFKNHLDKYPERDTDFVIENNSFKVKISCGSNTVKLVVIQRNALLYLLEHALFSETQGEGKQLLCDYFEAYSRELTEKSEVLKSRKELSRCEKSQFKKFFPKRLLHQYSEAQSPQTKQESALQKILSDAESAEKRYNILLKKAEKEEADFKKAYPNETAESLTLNFKKRNKGKHFKLQFMRKVWHVMYFRSVCKRRVQENGHHKRFHITKEEFNNFSKWLFAFDEVKEYPKLLKELFDQKGFFDNEEFKELFFKASNFDQLYEKTKIAFKKFLNEADTRLGTKKQYHLENYDIGNRQLFINISNFISFLENKQILKREGERLVFNALKNKTYLIEAFYYKEKLEANEYKSCGKLYNKLKTVKLEDCLLYEIALDYLKTDKNIVNEARKHISVLQTQNVIFKVNDADNKFLYKLEIPFNKLAAFEELKLHKEFQESKYNGRSFLSNLPNYLDKTHSVEALKAVSEFFKQKIQLKYEHLNSIYGHIMTDSAKFTKVALALERYFIYKDSLRIKKEHRIDFVEIEKLSQYTTKIERNKAFHFGVPGEEYKTILKQLEAIFINNEVLPLAPRMFNDLSKPAQNVCTTFLETIHDNFFEQYYFENNQRKAKETQRKYADAKEKYFNEIIKKNRLIQKNA